MTAWAHLPNAAVIDTIVDHFKAHPDTWADARRTACTIWAEIENGYDEDIDLYLDTRQLWGDAQQTVGAAAQDIAWTIVQDLATDAIQGILWGVVQALIWWPSSADMLSLTPDALRTIIDTCDGDVKHQAVLLLPAVIARSTP